MLDVTHDFSDLETLITNISGLMLMEVELKRIEPLEMAMMIKQFQIRPIFCCPKLYVLSFTFLLFREDWGTRDT